MKLTNSDKRQNMIDLCVAINRCEILSDAEKVQEFLNEALAHEQIFKCDYYIVRRKLEDRIRYLTEKGYV